MKTSTAMSTAVRMGDPGVAPSSRPEIDKIEGEPAQGPPKPVAFGPWPVFSSEDIHRVGQVLASGKVNYWTGSECREFEKEYAAAVGVKHAIALANGTLALELALRALGVGPGDEVIVTPRTFIASASCVVTVGAKPVFADVDHNSQNLSAETVAPKLTSRTKAIIAVHLAGWPCEMTPLLELANQYQIAVIEDCAQAHGAFYEGRPVGSLGRINAFSFCQDKIITTAGEGGLVTTDDPDLWRRAWSYKDHGKSYDAVYRTDHAPGFRWLHEGFGSNWRMLELQGAIGRRSLAMLGEWVKIRRRNAGILTRAFRFLPALRICEPPEHIFHSYYKYYAFVRPEALGSGWSRDRIMTEITKSGVPCFSGSCSEVYLEKAFAGSGFAPAERLPVARELGETSIMFLVHPTVTVEAMQFAADVATRVIKTATR